MQRPPHFNPNFPGGMPNPGMPNQMPPGNPNFGHPGPGQPMPGPGYGAPMGGHGPQNAQQGGGCFMPAATIRKISNTTPPNFNK